MKRANIIQILLGIVLVGVVPAIRAVVPAPDGGYPGGNTAEGQNALLSLTTGGVNTAIGFVSLRGIRPAASTQPRVPERFLPIPETQIPPPAQERF